MTTPDLDPEDLIALLEDGPKSVGQLATWVQRSAPLVKAHLVTLGRSGRVKRVGPQRLWALAAHPDVETVAAPAHREAEEESVPEAFDTDVVDPDLEAVDDEDFEPVRRRGPKPKLRQEPPASSAGPAWWVGLDRDAFQQRAAARRDEMARSKEARLVGRSGLV